MKHVTLSPAYGRDYKNQRDVTADFNNDLDFIVEDITNQWCGKPANKADLLRDGYDSFELRYSGKRKLVMLRV